jgi:hypothetical protein
MGQVAREPEGSMTMKVVQPLVLQRSRRDAAERRSLRCATDRWLKPAVVGDRDNILDSLSGAHPRVVCGVAIGFLRSTTGYGSERVCGSAQFARAVTCMLAAGGAHWNRPEV